MTRTIHVFLPKSLLALVVLTLGLWAPLHAQVMLGAITGTVKDSTGAVVAGATVKAVNHGTNLEVNQQSDANGPVSGAESACGGLHGHLHERGIRGGDPHGDPGGGRQDQHG